MNDKIFLKKLLKIVFFILIVVFFAIYLSINFFSSKKEIIHPKIGVTIYPFYDIVKEIIGNKFEVVLITPPGAEPHNFEPNLKIIKNLRGTKLIFASGLDIDNWALNIKNIFSDVKIVYFSPYVELLKVENEIDPHFWLSLNNAKKIAEVIKAEIINLDPKNEEEYAINYQNVLKKIEELETLAYSTKQQIKLPYLITQHNAFNYLAKELNLIILANLEGAHKELTPKELKSLFDVIKEKNIKVIFKEPGEESQLLKNLAKEINLNLFELDPLEGKSGLDYFSAYRKNLETLISVLK